MIQATGRKHIHQTTILVRVKEINEMKDIEQEVQEIKTDIKIIKENHLAHIEKDVFKMEKKIEKMDNRVWAILGLLVASVLAPMISSMF